MATLDATPRPPRPAPLPSADLELTLHGIAIESGTARAIVSDATRAFDVGAEGDALQLEPRGIVIARIGEDHIVVQFDGAEQTLALDD